MSIEQKLDKIIEIQTEQRVTLAAMETDLRHHIKRSDAHELKLDKQDKLINRLWLAVALLFGAGAGSSTPSILKWIGSIM